MVLYNMTENEIISNNVIGAYKIHQRMKGLLGRKLLEENSCMHIRPCNSIHTFFMKFPIDAVFLDRDMRVIFLLENIGIGKISPFVSKAYSVIELPAGRISSVAIGLGDRLKLK